MITGTEVPEVRRYDGATGAFIDSFVAAGSGGLRLPSGLIFGGPSGTPGKNTLNVKAVDLAGKPVSGLRTVIRNASNGTVIQTGFTSLVFAGDFESAYKISIANMMANSSSTGKMRAPEMSGRSC